MSTYTFDHLTHRVLIKIFMYQLFGNCSVDHLQWSIATKIPIGRVPVFYVLLVYGGCIHNQTVNTWEPLSFFLLGMMSRICKVSFELKIFHFRSSLKEKSGAEMAPQWSCFHVHTLLVVWRWVLKWYLNGGHPVDMKTAPPWSRFGSTFFFQCSFILERIWGYSPAHLQVNCRYFLSLLHPSEYWVASIWQTLQLYMMHWALTYFLWLHPHFITDVRRIIRSN